QTGSSAAYLGTTTLALGEDGDWDVVGTPELAATALPEGESRGVDSAIVTDVTTIANAAIEDAAVVGAEPLGSVAGDLPTSWDDTKASYQDGIRTADAPIGNQPTTKGDHRMRNSA